MNIPAQHRRVLTDRLIVAVDARGGSSRFTLHNPKKQVVEELRPEEFIPAGPGVQRCDFVYCVVALKRELYIELKGNRLSDALEQLKSTLRLLRLPLSQKLCFVVMNRSPSNTPDVQRQRLLFEKQTGCKLTVRSQQGEHHLL